MLCIFLLLSAIHRPLLYLSIDLFYIGYARGVDGRAGGREDVRLPDYQNFSDV